MAAAAERGVYIDPTCANGQHAERLLEQHRTMLELGLH
jgi:16S rRNA C1402 N4-methylase RsmH